MNTLVNFLGLNIGSGQEFKGLEKSYEHFLNYFPVLKQLGYQPVDQGQIYQSASTRKELKSPDSLRMPWDCYEQAYLKIQKLLLKNEPLVNWGGDHSVAISTVGAFTAIYPNGKILWIDAHADLNLPQYSPTGNLHGMPVSLLLNCEHIKSKYLPWLIATLKPENLIYLGLRDLDSFEISSIKDLGIQSYTYESIRTRGLAPILEEILDSIGGDPLHVSFDIDSVNPITAPATGVPVPGGFSIEDLKFIGREIAKHSELRSLDIVEINPLIGSAQEVFQTYNCAMMFLASLLPTDQKQVQLDLSVSI
jgi:arginase